MKISMAVRTTGNPLRKTPIMGMKRESSASETE
jgi:hypothetical protein